MDRYYFLIAYLTTTGFGGPYMPGMTDIGASIIYIFVFVALLIGLKRNSKTEEKISLIPENKKHYTLKILSLAAVILFAALIAPYLVDNSENQTSSSMSADMMQKTFDIPQHVEFQQFRLRLQKTPLMAMICISQQQIFTFTPQNINQAPIADQGHVHLYIDGTLYVVFGDWYHIPSTELPPGKHTVMVSLNANDHSVFWANGQNIQSTQTIYTY